MSVPIALLLILLLLIDAIGGKRGTKAFFTLCVNFVAFFVMLVLIAHQLEPITITIFACIFISSVTLFYINGINKKTVSSLLSVIVVVLSTILLTFKTGIDAKIQGFTREQLENMEFLPPYVHLDFSKIVICMILLGLLGAIIDVSISISSSMYEIHANNTSISPKDLFKSGINIGRDILGTMTNTLLFAYISGFLTLVIWFSEMHYTIPDIINSKTFCSEAFQILCSGIGIILIIPVTAFIMSRIIAIRTGKKVD